jgi:hypothetical protein
MSQDREMNQEPGQRIWIKRHGLLPPISDFRPMISLGKYDFEGKAGIFLAV